MGPCTSPMYVSRRRGAHIFGQRLKSTCRISACRCTCKSASPALARGRKAHAKGVGRRNRYIGTWHATHSTQRQTQTLHNKHTTHNAQQQPQTRHKPNTQQQPRTLHKHPSILCWRQAPGWPRARRRVAKCQVAKCQGGYVPGAGLPNARLPSARMPSARVPGCQMPGCQVPGARLPNARVPGHAL